MKLKGRTVQKVKTLDNGIRIVAKGTITKNDIRNNRVEIETRMGNTLATKRKNVFKILM